MGRVVKNARVVTQRYQVSVPRVDRPSSAIDDEGGLFVQPYAEPEPMVELPSPASPPVDIDLLAQQARELVDNAEARAKAMLESAYERAAALLAEAGERGDSYIEATKAAAQAAGHAEGTAAADREMSDMMSTMRNLVDMARVERHKLMESAEPELVRLAVGIAERVLHQQIALDRGVVVEMAKVAIARLVEKESITVRVNPGDLERMKEHRDELLDSGELKNFRVVEDQRVDRGGVLVETDGGTIDARISTQLNEAKRVLKIEDDVVVPPADRDSSLRAARAS
jgi:flagellar assembly protein FliH